MNTHLATLRFLLQNAEFLYFTGIILLVKITRGSYEHYIIPQITLFSVKYTPGEFNVFTIKCSILA